MTDDRGQTIVDLRAVEVARYVQDVRDALADLPSEVREDLLEDLAAHLSEVAAEDPAPLPGRLGPPAEYAAELRAMLGPAAEGGGRRRAGIGPPDPWLQWVSTRLAELDRRIGRLLGYERASEFGRLLVPALWVLRGYLAAMVLVVVLDQSGQIGLIPRLGGSNIAGCVILAAFVIGSVWLGRRTAGLGRWQRRAVNLATAGLVLYGLIGFVEMDHFLRWYWPGGPESDYTYVNPYEGVEDVYPVDEEGRLLTGVTLVDQNGNPIDIGFSACDLDPNPEMMNGVPSYMTYPCQPENAPWWLDPAAAAAENGR